MNKNYVLLKTKLSALTGGLVGLILGLLAVKLWFIWALLTFMLNFIPNVGSMIAVCLTDTSSLATHSLIQVC